MRGEDPLRIDLLIVTYMLTDPLQHTVKEGFRAQGHWGLLVFAPILLVEKNFYSKKFRVSDIYGTKTETPGHFFLGRKTRIPLYVLLLYVW